LKRLCQKRNKHIRLLHELFVNKKLDGIISVPNQYPAFTNESACYLNVTPFAARLANYWGFPSGAIPATCVREDEQYFDANVSNKSIAPLIKENMIDSKGLPMSLEIIGKPFHDEQILAIMRLLEDKFEFKKKNSFPFYE
jgi:Asp-tRNA(Asn)/Glu-tRNA(Gln) amidotransferase A subunit family amidase